MLKTGAGMIGDTQRPENVSEVDALAVHQRDGEDTVFQVLKISSAQGEHGRAAAERQQRICLVEADRFAHLRAFIGWLPDVAAAKRGEVDVQRQALRIDQAPLAPPRIVRRGGTGGLVHGFARLRLIVSASSIGADVNTDCCDFRTLFPMFRTVAFVRDRGESE